MSYTCPQCNTPLPDGSKFCHVCGGGVSTEQACPSCNAALQPGAAFCPTCGQALGTAGAVPRPPQGAYAAPWPGAQTAAGKPTSARVWVYAFSPLLVLLVFAVGMGLAAHSYSKAEIVKNMTAVLALINLLLFAVILADANLLLEKDGYVRSRQLLAKYGYGAGALRAWAIFVPPVYLYKRAKLLGVGQSHMVTFLITMAINFIGVIVVAVLAAAM